MKIGIQGELGAYSHIAANNLYKDAEIKTCATFEETFKQAHHDEDCKIIIPIENSLAGRVADIHYLLPKYKLQIHGEYFLNVEHNFLKAKKSNTINFKHKNFMKSLESYNMEYINTILDDPEIKEYNITDVWFQSKNKETIKELQKEKDTLKLTLDNRNSEFEKEKIGYIEEFNLKKELEINELKSSINVILDECNQDQDSDINLLIQKIREKLN